MRTELAALKALVREMVKILEEVDLTPAYDGRDDCCYCGRHAGHADDCERKLAEAIINRPEVRAIVEGE